MERTDEQIIKDYLNGDLDAFEILVGRYLKPLYNFVYRITGSTQDVDDIMQDVFVKVWNNIKKYRVGENFKTWVFTITRNTTIDYLRKKKHVIFSDFESDEGGNFLTDTLADTEPLADELYARMEKKESLEMALATLAPIYREVVLLHYREDLTFDEIGKIVNRPLHTVKSQHRRGLEKLKEYFDKDFN